MKCPSRDSSTSNEPKEHLNWLWPEALPPINMVGRLYAQTPLVTGSSTPPNNCSKGESESSSSSGGHTLTPTVSNSSYISMSSSGGPHNNGSLTNFTPTDPHPGTLVSTLDSPVGSPTGNRKTSLFSTPVANLKTSPFRYVNGRRFHSDESCPYILPCDIPELTRQGLKHHLFKEVFGGYHMADFSDPKKAPSKVLDIGCGTGIWVASMHDEFAARGWGDIKFFGMDIVPVHAPMTDIDFAFVRHDCLRFPYPFQDGEFDYIFMRDMTLTIPDTTVQPEVFTECLRILKEDGVLEVQCTDHLIRSISPTKALRTHCGAYPITTTTTFDAQPKNPHIQRFNNGLRKMLAKRNLSPTPCTSIGMLFSMESCLTNNHSVRYALPLDEVWWESADSPGERGGPCEPKQKNSNNDTSTVHQSSLLSVSDLALRYQAKLQVKQFIDSMETCWKEVRESPDEDVIKPYKEMTTNFFQEGGLKGGECMEFGAWWGTKKAC